jgi:hypothetical protein
MRLRPGLEATPLDGAAEERAWSVVRAAYADREPERRRVRPRLVLAVAAIALVAAALSPPGRAVLGSLRDALAPGGSLPRPASLGALPAPGRLLVESAGAAWIVNRDGSRRRLGAYRDATWSPHGLYVAAVAGGQLVALDPKGDVRWTIPHQRPVADPAWSPSGIVRSDTRIAYRAGSTLHLVGGDGVGDRTIAYRVAPVRPAWKPGPERVLAWMTGRGVLSVGEAETGRWLWSARPRPGVDSLEWSSDGALLLATGPRGLDAYDARGLRVWHEDAPAGTRIVTAAFVPRTHRIVEARGRGSQTTVSLVPGGRVLFRAAGEISGVAAAPDGRWLLLAWRSADQWLFLRTTPARRVVAVADVGRGFAPSGNGPADFPRLAGWCCAP